MAKNIEPKLKKIGDYLKLDEETIFTIPEYQRAYSWGIENCDKLWQDIADFVDSESKDRYFFGTIIINCQENDTKFSLIDGQQRTTTFLLLLKALLVRINEGIANTAGDEESVSLCRGLQERRRRIMGILYKAESEDIADMPDADKDAVLCGRKIILENFSINEAYRDELKTILQAADYASAKEKVVQIKYKRKDNRYTNFFRNFDFFHRKVSQLSESRLNTVAKAFTDNCEVIEIKSWQVEQAITMFNSLNSDGLPLYDSDIISAKLYAAAEKKGLEQEFGEQWRTLKAHVDTLSGMGLVDINSLLMQYMYYIRTLRKETVTAKDDSESVNVTTPGLRRYFTEINKDAVADPIAMCSDLIRLAETWKAVADAPALRVLLRFNENSKLFLAGYLLRFDRESIADADPVPVFESMLRLFALLELLDTGYSSRLFKTFLFREHRLLIRNDVSAEAIGRAFTEHIRMNWNEAAVRDALADYDGNALVCLNEYLFAKERGAALRLGGKYDVEHIMPASGSNLQAIRKDAGLEDEGEFRSLVNTLGNKILLEESINRAVGNEWFRTKVSTTLKAKTGYIDSAFPIARALVADYRDVDKPYWTKADILSATDKACTRIVRFIFGPEA